MLYRLVTRCAAATPTTCLGDKKVPSHAGIGIADGWAKNAAEDIGDFLVRGYLRETSFAHSTGNATLASCVSVKSNRLSSCIQPEWAMAATVLVDCSEGIL